MYLVLGDAVLLGRSSEPDDRGPDLCLPRDHKGDGGSSSGLVIARRGLAPAGRPARELTRIGPTNVNFGRNPPCRYVLYTIDRTKIPLNEVRRTHL